MHGQIVFAEDKSTVVTAIEDLWQRTAMQNCKESTGVKTICGERALMF